MIPGMNSGMISGAAAGGRPLLTVAGLRKAFGGVTAVAGIDFAVRTGEMVALIGPNGAGKTTCFNLINGQLRPDAGRVLVAPRNASGRNASGRDVPERDVTGLAPHAVWALGIGRTFQIPAAFASMSVRENVQTALLSRHRQLFSMRRAATGLHVEEADRLLQRVGVADQAGRPCGVLAYGDLKRVELAIALAGDPVLLLMDEPTAGMSPQERTALMALVADIVRERHMGVLFTEHDMDVVFGHADRILVLHRGTLIAAGSPMDVRADPQVRAVYLGEDSSSMPDRLPI